MACIDARDVATAALIGGSQPSVSGRTKDGVEGALRHSATAELGRGAPPGGKEGVALGWPSKPQARKLQYTASGGIPSIVKCWRATLDVVDARDGAPTPGKHASRRVRAAVRWPRNGDMGAPANAGFPVSIRLRLRPWARDEAFANGAGAVAVVLISRAMRGLHRADDTGPSGLGAYPPPPSTASPSPTGKVSGQLCQQHPGGGARAGAVSRGREGWEIGDGWFGPFADPSRCCARMRRRPPARARAEAHAAASPRPHIMSAGPRPRAASTSAVKPASPRPLALWEPVQTRRP